MFKEKYGGQHPIYYKSNSFLYTKTRYSHPEKLILSLLYALITPRYYFETHPIWVKTNYPIKNAIRKHERKGECLSGLYN